MVIFWLVSYPIFVWRGYVKQSHLEEYQRCIEQFSFSNYKLECRVVGGEVNINNTTRPGGYMLYVIPTVEFADAYVSIEVANERLTCGKQADFSLYYEDYVPSGLETIATDDWHGFWNQLQENSTNYTSTTRKLIACGLLFWSMFVLSRSNADDDGASLLWQDILFLTVFVGSFIGECYYQSQITRVEREFTEIIEEYQGIFASQHVYMEYCHHVFSFHWLVGGIPRRYLFFYPVRSSNAGGPL